LGTPLGITNLCIARTDIKEAKESKRFKISALFHREGNLKQEQTPAESTQESKEEREKQDAIAAYTERRK
jgi:hypothetical protein